MLVYSFVDDNMVNENFKEFLSYCLSNSTYFSLTFIDDNIEVYDLNKFLIKSFDTDLWYCYKVFENPLHIKLYKSDISLLNPLLEYFSCLFPKNTKGIEDICFFKDTDIMFGSVTHENLAQIILSNKNNISIYNRFGKWRKEVITERAYEFFPNLKSIL